MAQLESLTRGARVRGVVGDRVVTVVDSRWYGQQAIELTYKIDENGQVGSRLVYRTDEPTLELIAEGAHWAFDAPGDRFRLAMEAARIRLAYLFDPLLALSTSQVEALPHQIGAVYETMLHRQPLRFLLADDPGAGKTIMAGLLIKELLLRGDVERCLIVVPASLEYQWQDELEYKFNLRFDVLGRSEIENAATNAFAEHNLLIGRIDLLKQDENLERLASAEWDLVVVDEAHKMSASYDTSGERRLTARYKLGQLLAGQARHLLLMTATPHRGKEADFQLFMALLDGDRFEGRYRDGVHQVDPSDLMRRLLKEEMVDFDGHPLFPERRAYTVNYDLSPVEEQLYLGVTDYVTNEMSRADRMAQEEGGEGNKKRAVVGFALTSLQRRLASSPNAIYRSLERRRRRLESTLEEARIAQRLAERRSFLTSDVLEDPTLARLSRLSAEELEDELDERSDEEVGAVVDAASAARNVAELEHEIGELRKLERLAKRLYDSGEDSKWVELSRLLQDRDEMFDPRGRRLKLVIFTEHKDTLDYLHGRIGSLIGDPEAVVVIHGGLGRDDRRKAQEQFVNDPNVLVLVATDAAGEGINLQRAHLMVNYDLPWNPNRIEQRFGRIHRFGQREVCHLWNLVAYQTREGAVFKTLLDKLEVEREALGGKVFDVLGKLFEGDSLRDLLLQAIRYGDRPEVRARLQEKIADVAGRAHFMEVLAEQALNAEQFGQGRLEHVKDLMQRAQVNRLVPHFIASFFEAAFTSLGGSLNKREPGRFEIAYVPAELRRRSRALGRGVPLVERYARICFAKEDVHVDGKPDATFVAPGQPLLDTTIDLIREREGSLIRRGAVLLDPRPEAEALGVRALFCIRHDITDGHTVANGDRRVISGELHFVEVDEHGAARGTVQAPYLDYEPLGESRRLKPRLGASRHETRLRGLGGDSPPTPQSTPPLASAESAPPFASAESTPPIASPQSTQSVASPQSTQVDFVAARPLGADSSAGPHGHPTPPTAGPTTPPPDTLDALIDTWRRRDLDGLAIGYAVEHLVPAHVDRVREEREALVTKAMAAVHDRLTREITYWDHRATELKDQELAGKRTRLSSGRARERADELASRLKRRMADLELERQVVPQAPVVIAGALIIPKAWVIAEPETPAPADLARDAADAEAKRRTELAAMRAVIAAEEARGRHPRDVSKENLGYDVESRDPATGRLRFIEVKGRDDEAETLTLTRNECMAGMNLRGDFWLAVVPVRDGEAVGAPRYVDDPVVRALTAEPQFGLVSVLLDIGKVLAMGNGGDG